MSALLQREMKKRRIGCELGRTLKDVRVEGGMVRAMLGASPFIKEPTPAQMKETPIEAETVLVTVGRAPNTAGLGLAEAGVAVDGRGWIRADEHMRTSLPGVYAVGDVRTKAFRQVVTAVGDGAVAGLAAARFVEDGQG